MAVPGSILVVVHDFEARSPDELSLSKNDRIELLERDDEFGDGWYLGRHLRSNQTGLFPEGTNARATSFQVHAGQATVTQNVSYLHAGVGDFSLQRTEMAQQSTVCRLMSSPTNISSHLRQNVLVRDDISSRHQAEIDRRDTGRTLVFPLPPNRSSSQVKQKAAFFPKREQEDITTSQYSEINSQVAGGNQFSSSTNVSPQSKQKARFPRNWEISSCHQTEIGPQSARDFPDISTISSSPGAVLSRERDEISGRVQAELVRRIAAGIEAPLQPSSASPGKHTVVHSDALEEIVGRVQAELYHRVATKTGAILLPSTASPDKAPVRPRSLEDVFKNKGDKVEQFDAPALCPLPLFSTPPRAKRDTAFPRVEETPSRQQKPIKRATAPRVASSVAPSARVVYPPSPCLTFKSESTEVSNHFDLEDYLACVYTTTAPEAATTSTTSTPEPTTSADVQLNPVATPASSVIEEPRATSPILPSEFASQVSQPDQNANQFDISTSTPPPLNSPGAPISIPSTALRNISIATGNQHIHGEESPVMSETLSVIDEHITDMSTPRHSITTANRRGANDSSSEYSSHAERQLSYITGELTDEEEHCVYSEAQVLQWSPTDVATYLHGVGVESYHCQVFQEQEISGEVLLGMSQSDLFIEAFDLGLLGRRLRTWHKIRALQDETKGARSTSRNTDSYYGADGIGGEDAGRTRGAVLPRIPSLMERPGSRQQHDRRSVRQTSQQQIMGGYSMSPPTLTPLSSQDSPPRPPASSSRGSIHKRRHSSIEVRTVPSVDEKDGGDEVTTPTNPPTTPHKKNQSFDRSWTMGESAPPMNGRPSTSTSGREFVGGHKLSTSFDRNRFDGRPRDSGYTTLGPKDLDRGYFSGGELDNVRMRSTLKKRDSGSHSRKSSYADEQRVRAGTAHSRYSSTGSIRELGFASITLPTASQIYHGKSMNDRLRAAGKNNIFMPTRALKDPTSPTVTKLDSGVALGLIAPGPDTDASSSGRASPMTMSHATKPVGPTKLKRREASGLRAISDAVTGGEKARLESSAPKPGESPVRSPTGTGSSTPSGSKSFDSDPYEGRKPMNGSSRARASSGTTRRKSKKETSAYREGLEEKTPQEAIGDCDYSGWMRKKSSKLIAVWNQRLFVLRGTRLAYYYSENDQREKGVIDIAFHRVLTAENDRITGLHATLTGVTASPTSPQGTVTPTSASTDAAAESEPTPRKMSNDSVFIFKLVPPRAGLSKAVTFTMPKVHYFAVDNIRQGRLWMAALMKATIDRDDTSPITSTYQLKTISLTKARAMRQRPPALMGPDEKVDEEPSILDQGDEGLNIRGIIFDGDADEEDSEIGVARTEGGVRKASSFDGANT